MIPLLLAFVVAGCGEPPTAPVRIVDAPLARESPGTGDRGERCHDVLHARVCWDPGCPAGVCSVERPVPDAPVGGGWRCNGAGAGRRCVPRSHGAGPFACAGDRCTQSIARAPDDGEWECFDQDGAALCRGGREPAGVRPGPPDPGWLCGDHPDGARICVDLSPDMPDDAPRGWRCHYEHEQGQQRVCIRDEAAPVLARSCAADSECPRATRCSGRRCLPIPIAVECWFDADCGDRGPCRLATCTGRAR